MNKKIHCLIVLLAVTFGFQALAQEDWTAVDQEVKVYRIKYICHELFNDEEDGSLIRNRDFGEEYTVVRFDSDGDVIDVYFYDAWRDGRDKVYDGPYEGNFVVSYNDGRRGLVEVNDDVMLCNIRNGEVNNGRGQDLRSEVDGPNQEAFIIDCRLILRMDRRLTRLLTNDLQDGQVYRNQVWDALEAFLEGRGYTHDD